MEEVIVTIQEGEVKAEVAGVKGARCLQLTKVIEELIGKAEGRTLKREFWAGAEIRQSTNLETLLRGDPDLL
jgi:hypothetical protein